MSVASYVQLGFAVPSGEPVEIPIRHTAVCGMTQEAGKTTALEALITRADLPALTFITKRGEASFQRVHRIDPYFREQADWQFVASILEASRGEKLKFERAWIIRASKGARTLADVHRNVRHALEKAKGLSADVYLTLDAYLEAVVPQIATVRWAPSLSLARGVNAMDLTGLTVEMQHLVIRSALYWVLEREENVVVVVPEAWKFIPQGRGTPVKLAAEAFIRQAAALRNYLWLDSQDLGGIDKAILRSVPVWILGVQREANELKRTLENIPAGTAKPKPADIAMLELGQFFACWGRHAVKTYVQPTWLNDEDARRVAMGDTTIPAPPARSRPKEDTVTPGEAQALRDENAHLKRDNEELRHRLEALEQRPSAPVPPKPTSIEPPPGAPAKGPSATPRSFSVEETLDNERLYQAFKARLIEELPSDSQVMAIVVSRPELQVQVKRAVITVDGDTLQGRIAQLMAEGFFDDAVGPGTVCNELIRRGAGTDVKFNVSKQLQSLTTMGFLVRDGKTSDTRYQIVPAMKINIVEAA